ncbi:MAG: ADP-ribosylglycohydrolase family protein [Clostridia bacterium]|nr:ADP-ribosylglycohydrolase family protein [Clostridia bacterium]
MKKAWEIECETMRTSIPVVLEEEEQGWKDCEDSALEQNRAAELLWHSNVPGSGATEHVIVAAMQDMENMGYDVSEVEKLIDAGAAAVEKKDYAEMMRLAAEVFRLLNIAPKIPSHPYWQYRQYESFEDYEKDVSPRRYDFDTSSPLYEELTYYGWIAQICGGALGTAIEGYTKENIEKVFGDIRGYVRKPNTYNDDITYELAFLEALEKSGKGLTSADIAGQWVALIPAGWSAEDRALQNLKLGIFPPESGRCNNPYREWIGAQMRGAVCGMVAPGDPYLAAKLAFTDGQVSHHNNGVLGEVFNAVLVSLAYVKTDVREIVEEAVSLIPEKSEYASVVRFALEQCRTHGTWQEAWAVCEKRYERYNWIHAYPNAAAEVVALWFGEGDFDETMHISAMQGYDVDCNAAQIASVVAIASRKNVPAAWRDPIGDELITYMRKIKKVSIRALAKKTVRLGAL